MTTLAAMALVSRFCTPTQRETSGKAVQALETAKRVDVLHTTVTSYPNSTTTDQVTLACYCWGEGEKIVILTHGWEWQAGRMSAFVQPLLEKGFRVVAFDAPAHGQSEGAELNLPDYARSIRTVAQCFGEPYAVVGHSFGGLAAAWYAAHEPNALHMLVSISSGSGGEFLMRNYVAGMQLSEADEHALREGFRDRFGGTPTDYSVAHFGKDIRARTLIVHDRRDNVVGFDQAALFVAHIPNVQLHATSGLGHRAILRAPEVPEEVARFVGD